jgi:hypothetical protein
MRRTEEERSEMTLGVSWNGGKNEIVVWGYTGE